MFAIAMSIVALGNVFVESGISTSLIRSDEVEDKEYTSVFYYLISLGAIIMMLVYFSASYIAILYGNLSLTLIVQSLSWIILIRALSAVFETRLHKKMDFKKSTFATIVSIFFSSALGIILALKNKGIHALVYMVILQQVIYFVVLVIVEKWKPQMSFSWFLLRKHLKFGWKLSLAGFLNTFSNEIYNLIIGKYFSVVDVGFFNRAESLRKYPIQNFVIPVSKVMLPFLARSKNDNKHLKYKFRDLLQFSGFIMFPILFGMIIFADELIVVLFSEAWRPAAPFLSIICLAGFFYPIHVYNLNLLKIFGHSDLYLKLDIIKKSIFLVLIVISIPFGITVLIWTQVLNSMISAIINTYYSKKLIGYGLGAQMVDLLKILIISLITGIVGYIIKYYVLNNFGSLTTLLIAASVCSLLYFTLSLFYKSIPSILQNNYL